MDRLRIGAVGGSALSMSDQGKTRKWERKEERKRKSICQFFLLSFFFSFLCGNDSNRWDLTDWKPTLTLVHRKQVAVSRKAKRSRWNDKSQLAFRWLLSRDKQTDFLVDCQLLLFFSWCPSLSSHILLTCTAAKWTTSNVQQASVCLLD